MIHACTTEVRGSAKVLFLLILCPEIWVGTVQVFGYSVILGFFLRNKFRLLRFGITKSDQ